MTLFDFQSNLFTMRNVLVVFLLILGVLSQHVPSEAELWKSTIDYGIGIPSTEASYSISGVLLSGPEATSLFQLPYKMRDDNFYPFPTVGATKISSHFRAIANTQSDLFSGGLANIEYHSASLYWVSGNKTSPNVLVTNTAQNTFFTSLGATVTQLDVTSSSVPEDIDVLVLDYSSYSVWSDSTQNKLYDVTAEFMSREANNTHPKGIIIGGDPSYYKWLDYGDCSNFPGNRALQEHGITFICDYWGTREKYIEPSTLNYLQENMYFALNYLADINGRAYTDSDVENIVDFNILQKMLPAIYYGCACSQGQDSQAPTATMYDVFKPLLVDILEDDGCKNMEQPMNSNYEKYCAELIYTEAFLYNDAADVNIALTSDIFPGMNSGIDASDVIPSETITISTNFCLKQTTGLWAAPGHPFTVTIPPEYIGDISLTVGIWNGDVRKFSSWERIPGILIFDYPLDASTTTIANAFGGPIYINIPCDYFEDNGSFLEFDVTITEAVPMIYFKRGETTEEDWNNQLATRFAPWAEIEADFTIYTIPRENIAVESFATIQSVADNWSIIAFNYADFRDKIPDLFKERGIVDVHVAYGYMFASYPINGPLGEVSNLLHDPNAWGWLHEMGHRFERGNSYGPEAGAMWNMFNGNVEVFTNVFSCIGILAMDGDNSRCVNNNGAPATIGSSGWNNLGPFEKLDFYMMLRDGFGWEAFTNTLTRGRTFRFPDNDNDKRTRLWLLLSERVGRNIFPLFDMYEIDVAVDGLYNQIILSDLATSFIRMNNPPIDISESSSHSTITSGSLLCGETGPSQLFSTSTSCSFSSGGTIEYNLPVSETGELSISFWMNYNVLPGSSISIIEQSTNENIDWKISLESSGSLSISYDANSLIQSSVLNSNEWFHILITADINSIIIYVNGVEDNSIIPDNLFNSFVTSSLKMNIDGLYDGSLSEVAIFNHILEGERALAHYSPSPYHFKPWISPRYLPEPIPDCPTIPQDITACQTREGLFGDTPSDCDACLAYLCNGDPEPVGIDCSPVCSSGTIIDAFSGACLDCDSTCLECSSPNDANACTSCNLDSATPYFQNSQCVSECQSNYYLEDGPHGPQSVCEPCDSTCNTCTGPNSADCITCINGLVFNEGECLSECPLNKVQLNDQCVDNCPNGMYADADNICNNCSSSCDTCVESMNNCLSCDENGLTPYYNSDFNTCSSSCGSGYYHETDSYLCDLCSSNCLTCSNSAEYCTSCDTNGLEPYYFFNACYSDCPQYTFQNEDSFTCEGCDINGEFPFELDGECVSECNPGQVIHYYECIDNCPQHFFNNSGYCDECSSNCAECSSFSVCIACGGSEGLLYNSQCVASCPSITFENNGNCLSCSSSCETCNGPTEFDCLSCNSGNYLTENGECVEECTSSTFPNQDDFCQNCDTTCETCSAGTSSDCITCTNGRYLHNEECLLSCPSGYFGNDETNACDMCDAFCLTCSGSSSFCTSCDSTGDTPILSDNTCEAECDGFTLEDNCLVSCPIGYFANELNECIICNSECQTCINSPDTCVTCDASGLTPFYDDNQSTCISNCRTIGEIGFEFECTPSCPDGLYDDETSPSCLPCDSDCLLCNSDIDCVQCNPLSQNNKLYNGICVSNCPSGTFLESNICINCHGSCASCSSDTNNDCTSCFSGFHLENGECVEDIDECIPNNNNWILEITSMNIVNIQKNYPIEDFHQEMLCLSDTFDESCIPYGSSLQTLGYIDFTITSSISCTLECEDNFNHNIAQNYQVVIDASQNMFRIISLIEDLEVIHEQFTSEIDISLTSTNILDNIYQSAESIFQIALNESANSVCSSSISTLPDVTLPSEEIEIESIGDEPIHACNILPSSIPRCICDSSVDNMANPCQNIRNMNDLFSDAICHTNHCENTELPENYIRLELDTEYSLYSDEFLLESITILNTWISQQELSQETTVRVFKVDQGSVILIIDVINNISIDTNTLIELYNALGGNEIDLRFSIIQVALIPTPFPESITPSRSPTKTFSTIASNSPTRTPSRTLFVPEASRSSTRTPAMSISTLSSRSSTPSKSKSQDNESSFSTFFTISNPSSFFTFSDSSVDFSFSKFSSFTSDSSNESSEGSIISISIASIVIILFSLL